MKQDDKIAFSRRQFGAMLGATAMAGALAGCAGVNSTPAGEGSVLSRIGIQVYSIRESYLANPLASLQAIAAAGFAEVELWADGVFNLQPAVLKDYLDQTGLAAPSIHLRPDDLSERLDDSIKVVRVLGTNHVVLPAAPPATRKSVEGYREVARLCTRAARHLATEGISFYYHNHDWEFAKLDGDVTGYDILTGETDPALVKLELDLYWALKGGQDIFQLFDTHAGRIEMCHVKDMKTDGAMTLPGEGTVDFQAIFDQASKAGLRHFFVEDDRLLTVDQARLDATVKHLSGMRLL